MEVILYLDVGYAGLLLQMVVLAGASRLVAIKIWGKRAWDIIRRKKSKG